MTANLYLHRKTNTILLTMQYLKPEKNNKKLNYQTAIDKLTIYALYNI